ncbi:MAG: apolipoprotein N-acyltransferase, partial [Betaproteobacteria bacterium]|nr:apolipoprotein N-acyltransferase [Betaproteobacteria bacterium]
ALQRRSLRGAVGVALALAAMLGGGAALSQVQWSVPHGAPITVALIQGNIPQEEKFAQDHLARNLDTHLRLIAQARGDLIVTPETAIPVLPQQLPPDVLPALAAHLQSTGSAALVGIPLERGPGQYTNSVIGMGGEPLYRYDKHHLVPFGEFIPWGFHWFVRLMNIPLGDFERGALDQPSFVVKGQRVAPTICYEDVFGDELRARFADATQAPTLIANLTNLAWFGNTVAIAQHLQIARMRSIEFARPSIRATNTGATAVIDAQGRVTHALTPWTRGTLEATVQGRSGLTPYARYGDAWLWAVLLGLVAAVAVGWRRRRNAPVVL